jgi:hypothetical protein
LLYCTGSALAAILQNTCPNENLISKLVHVLREDLHKDTAGHVSKSEFISWSTKMIITTASTQEANLVEIYQKIFLSPSRSGGSRAVEDPKDDDRTVDENPDHQSISTPLDSLHPDFNDDDETIASREEDGN